MIKNAHLPVLMQKILPRQIIRRPGLYVLILIVVFSGACSKRPAQRRPFASQNEAAGQTKTESQMSVPVMAEPVEQKTTSVELGSFGTVEASASVDVKTQITGILTGVHFTEGQMVKKGDLLLSIDPRQPKAALEAAQANLEKDQAQLKNAEKEAARQTELLNKGIVSQDDYDKSITEVETLRAAAKADKAAVDNAALQLDYCSVRSPIDGCIGILHVHQGNLVKADETSVVTIKQIDPIYVSFWVPEQNLPTIQKYMAIGNLDVKVIQPYEKPKSILGSLTFVDNTIDASANTRTIRLRATFSNKDRRLWPGQYVNVVLTLAQEPNSLVIPFQAVQTSQHNQFVYVVRSDGTVEARPVTVKRTMNNESVVEGLQSGELVVTDGQLRLVPGARVEIKNPAQK
jgi:multidrug efflux system membrane fusion protein